MNYTSKNLLQLCNMLNKASNPVSELFSFCFLSESCLQKRKRNRKRYSITGNVYFYEYVMN